MSETSARAKAKDDQIVVEKKNTAASRKHMSGVDPSFNMDELRELANLVIEHGFTDFEFENENIRVRLSKASAQPLFQPAPVASPPPSTALGVPAEAAPASPAADPDADLFKITSPIVGTFYRSPGPDKQAYVTEGSTVSPETTVCIVEAMKLMNEIQAEVSGEVVRIYVENGEPVEYGQPLFGIRK
ncbi:MAG TPA: acetyl-CoA carboxylase biotin carboxyl carrier protein [Pyrinomonadaceae bacterium]|nr:acetyl-CoA carboxylase biotin carboxyl carrier protein [Pyrinomonadaceae bacterium]